MKITSSAMNSYLYLGDYDKFLASLPDAGAEYILFYRGFAEYYKGDDAGARAHFDRAFEMNPALLPAEVGKALAYGLRHENAAGVKLLREAEGRMQERGVADGEGLYKVCQAYAELGDGGSALRILRQSIGRGFYPYPYFQTDPLLKKVRGVREFAGLMEEARKRYEQFRKEFGDGAR